MGKAVGLGMLCELMIAIMEKKMIYIIHQKILKKFGLPIKLRISQKNRLKVHEGIYKGVFSR